MAIPEAQLEAWSHQGAIAGSRDTYRAIKGILEAADTPYSGMNFRVFLQGSYCNDTNIRAESDVDTVVVLEDTFQSDLGKLGEDEQTAYRAAFEDATYGHAAFKRDVVDVLVGRYGQEAVVGDKAITIGGAGQRRKADVVVAIEFRRYHRFRSVADSSYEEGICFWTGAGLRIVNYPRQHSENLTTQHQRGGEWLKPMVRVCKNLRNRCVAQGLLRPGAAPSYFVEGLLYNIPPDTWGRSYQESFIRVFEWIQRTATKEDLVCANEQFYLLRDGVHNCWPRANGEAFLNAAVSLWKDW